MNLEIEKKAKVKNFHEIKKQLELKYGVGKPIEREDYYLYNNKKQEIRISVVKYIDSGREDIEITHKKRIEQTSIEVNQEYILFCDNNFSNILDFWKSLEFLPTISKIKKYFDFQTDEFKIALIYFLEIKNGEENILLPDFYLEVECVLPEYLAKDKLNDFFLEMNLTEMEEKRYIDII